MSLLSSASEKLGSTPRPWFCCRLQREKDGFGANAVFHETKDAIASTAGEEQNKNALEVLDRGLETITEHVQEPGS